MSNRVYEAFDIRTWTYILFHPPQKKTKKKNKNRRQII